MVQEGWFREFPQKVVFASHSVNQTPDNGQGRITVCVEPRGSSSRIMDWEDMG